MRRAILILLGAGAILCGSAFAQNPSWLQRPDAAAFEQFYPPAALHQGVAGAVRLQCEVQLDTTAQCRVVEETPTDWGFADAALAISRSFRFTPAVVNGRPVAGGRVNVPMRFNFAPPDQIPEQYRNLMAHLPQDNLIDLPTWDEAPTYAVVKHTFSRPWDEGFLASVLLSCGLSTDRRLRDCSVERANPANVGAEQAALALAGQFRVSANESEFLARYAGGRFLLPLAFGGPPTVTPVDWSLDHLSASALSPVPPEFLVGFYPQRAREAGLRGEVILRCSGGGMACTVFYEAPENQGFGAAATAFMSAVGQFPSFSAALPADVYVPFLFVPDQARSSQNPPAH